MRHIETIFHLILLPFLFIAKILTLQKVNFDRKGMPMVQRLTPIVFLLIFFSFDLHAGTIIDACPPGANTANVNGNYNGNVTHQGHSGPKAWDSYSVSIPSSGDLTINYTSTKNTRLWYSTDNTNYCRQNRILPNGRSISNTLAVTAGETVYIQLREMVDSGTANYSFTLAFTPPPEYTCPGTDVLNINGATGDASQTYSIGNDITYDSRYFKFKTAVDGNITIRQENNKPVDGYWNHQLKIGTGCQGTTIYNGGDSSDDSHTFSVTAGTTYYVRVREGNTQNVLNFDISFYFVAASSDPTANAGSDQTVTVGTNVTLDGSASSDTDGTITSYSWTDGNTTWTGVSPTVSTAGWSVGDHTITLTVTDDHSATDTDTVTITIIKPCGNTNGLTGEYYNNETFSGSPVLTRIDPTIDFNWGSGSPDPSVNNDHFSVVWTGYILIPETATYTFSFLHDDDLVVTIGGTTIYTYNTWSGNNWRSDGSSTLTAGCHTIRVTLKEGGGGASARMRWKNDAGITSDVIVPESHLFVKPSIVNNADDICYLPPQHEGNCTGSGDYLGGINCIQTVSVLNYKGGVLADAKVGIGITGVSSSTYLDCGVDGVSGSCDQNWTGLPDDTVDEGITFSPLSFAVDQNHSLFTESNRSAPLFDGDNLYGTYAKGTDIYQGQVNACDFSYCKTHGLSEGFHIIDPDGGDDANSYEVYCDNSTLQGRDLITLPLKNDYNNFSFLNDLPQKNYYRAADNAKSNDPNNGFSHLQIKIDTSDHSISVVPESIAAGSTNNEGYFSNINLIGTPYAIDWSATSLSNCDVGKLRIGADDQAVKIDTLDYTKGRCKVESMKLKLLDDYRYIKWPDINNGDEVLKETCRRIFETVPDAVGYLPSASSDGHYWIDPDQGGRGTNDTLTTLFRPIVATCQYQHDIGEAWTFIMALDGKVTNSRIDVKTMLEVRANPSINHDTCSQIGLLFFVPNTKDTFNRVREYLKDEKSEWIDYTGTIREKFQMYGLATEYYKKGEGYNEIWPYGPFGVYHPYGGNKDINNNPLAWRDVSGKDTQMGNGSGRCMNSGSNSGASACADYTQRLPAVANDDGSLGAIGWRTTLEDMVNNGLAGINSGDQFWIADVGAGNYIHDEGARSGTPECSITSAGSNRATSGACDEKYYEPNGNYYKDAWLNFVADSNGNVYHNDDWNNNYPYYDYMCMAWDNYHSFTRIESTAGPFTVIDTNTANQPYDGKQVSALDLNITTKIAKRDMDFQIVTFDKGYDEAGAVVSKDQNISAGVFLTYITTVGNNDIYHEEHYLGDIGGSNSPSLPINTSGYHDLTATDLGGDKRVAEARRKMQFRFKYCQFNENDWTSCWDPNNVCIASCDPESITCNCKYASSDFFAVRPKEFQLGSTTQDSELLTSGKTYAFSSIVAVDDSGTATSDYDQVAGNIDKNSTLYLNTGIPDDNNTLHGTVTIDVNTSLSFTDGTTSGNINVAYDDVAKINIELYDNDWASVDSTDSPDICNNTTPPYGIRICSDDSNLTFIPDHFNLSNVKLFNHGKRLTYLTYQSDLNMSAPVEANVTARNANDEITKNFREGDKYYENPVALTVTIPTTDTNNNSVDLVAVEHNISTAKLGFKIGAHMIDWDENNATQKLMFNYNKILNQPKNPFTVNSVELNITSVYNSSSGNTEKVDGNATSDGNATFYYAKFKSSEYFYENVTESFQTTPISILIYCSLSESACNSFGISTTSGSGGGATDENNWFFSLGHSQDLGDGDIALRIEDSPLIEGIGNPTVNTKTYPGGAGVNILDLDDGVNKDVNITTGGASLPMTVGIDIVEKDYIFAPPHTDTWLLYNKDNNESPPSPLYKVRFIGAESDWTGVGTTGHAMDINISSTSTKRMDW